MDVDRGRIPGLLLDILADHGGFEDVRILTSVKNGLAGTRDTNAMFHQGLACGKVDEQHGVCEGEPVIWTENDYHLDLMSGTLGEILKVAEEGLVLDWDKGVKAIVDLKNKDHAYAITVHKSQGGQFKRCVIPVFKNKLLDRIMLYTAITRAEEQVLLIGDRNALENSIADPPSTSLRDRLALLPVEFEVLSRERGGGSVCLV